jgi:hypothetical protein
MLFFPRSAYLARQWWHRLATVIFWFWFVFVLGFCWHIIFASPFTSCINTKIQTELLLQVPSNLDCGSNAISYFVQNLKTSSLLEIAGGFVIFVLALYVVLLAPSLIYRLVLYVAKGSAWRDAKTIA